ncbi:MAG: ABC transporter ATP-binding protein [Acidimicrobiales bacterium]|jgi:peptide/nickel transport system ATP-binding protein
MSDLTVDDAVSKFRAPIDSATPLLVVDNLKTHFELPAGMVKAVDGVSFELNRGRTIGIVGESGSGKTVLSRSIMRLVLGNNVHTSGGISFEGRDILALSTKQMTEIWGLEMAMVFQDPMTSLNPVVKIGRQVTEHVRKHLGMSKSEAKASAIELLRSVRIPEAEARFDAYPHELSGGMRQRVCIAIALACGPKLLFADEPTTALDVTVQHQILNLLRQQQSDRDMGMILVTHDLGVVAGRTDEIAVMYAGKIVEKAATTTLFDETKHPYTEALLRSIPRTSERNHTRLSAIAGRPPDLINPPKGCSFSPRCPYAQAKCFEEEPTLEEAATAGHTFACWYPIGTPENAEAWDRNLALELPQTMAVAKGQLVDESVIDAATITGGS